MDHLLTLNMPFFPSHQESARKLTYWAAKKSNVIGVSEEEYEVMTMNSTEPKHESLAHFKRTVFTSRRIFAEKLNYSEGRAVPYEIRSSSRPLQQSKRDRSYENFREKRNYKIQLGSA
ncbi:hypothetical protein AVEN_191837-1 [Araneus ventricosus]|uniref:Uncharacterized protein n=1 Tax=Araneus ventricosus TaxID=182803 RepID=A0A4Y2F0P7_ARAVE|nr:hypothetical protein AVEN_191837-1 [Araneus ventricosus]